MKIYVVDYVYELFEENKEYERRETLALFTTWEKGVEYVRKFFEGDKNDPRKFYDEQFIETKCKSGDRIIEVKRSYREGSDRQKETLILCAIPASELYDSGNPFEDIKKYWGAA